MPFFFFSPINTVFLDVSRVIIAVYGPAHGVALLLDMLEAVFFRNATTHLLNTDTCPPPQIFFLQESCSLQQLWQGAYTAQPSIGEMVDWLQDILNALVKETALRFSLCSDLGYEFDSVMQRAAEMWSLGVFYRRESFREALERVKIHCIL